MKTHRLLFHLAWMLLPFFAFSQPEIISVVPSAALPGETVNVAVTGSETHFQQGITTLEFGAGIQVLDVQVNHDLYLTAVLKIEPNLPPGFRNLEVATGSEKASFEQALEILEPGAQVNVVLTIIPVQTLYLGDLDPNHPENNPLLFTVSLYNDNLLRNLRVEFHLSNEEFGFIGSAVKNFPNLPPLAVETFDNRQFDDYNLDPASPEIVNIAAETGVMPAGTYTYSVLVFDENGNVIASDDGVHVITNETANIDLIGPGAPLDQSPEVISLQTPFFQWFSTLTNFTFSLFEVNEGQSAANDIVANLPVFQETGLASGYFQYPISAEILERGKTYAWQVTAPFESSQGTQTVFSEVFWFRLGEGSGYVPISTLDVSPETVSLSAGSQRQFTATGYDQNGAPASLDCTWNVVPANAGTVDANGIFTAGNHPGAAAVVATCNGLQAYGTAIITWSVTDQFFDAQQLFKQVFGLQKN